MSSKFMKNAFVGWTFTAGLYYPPDFDSSKLMPMKHLKPKGPQMLNMRMMFPFTMICDACGEYNYTGTKFTAKVEDIKHESYLGMKVYRFYGRCRHCWAEFTFKTDPKNSDYTMESGGKRTYEAWKDADMVESQLKAEKEKEAELDNMKALEQKSIDVQAEMERLEDLDAIRSMNKRLGAREQTIEEALQFIFEREQKKAVQEEAVPEGDLAEMAGFKEAQEERRRMKLDEEVERGAEASTATSSSASSSGATGSGAKGAGLSSSASTPSGPTSASAALLSAAVAERVNQTANKAKAAGARFSVKRKAAPESAANASDSVKRPHIEEAATTVAATADAGAGAASTAAGTAGVAGSTGGGGLGLGAYDSDSS